MALVLADRVLETSTTSGSGTITLAGASVGYQSFSTGVGNGMGFSIRVSFVSYRPLHCT